jgi:hypothetical protein
MKDSTVLEGRTARVLGDEVDCVLEDEVDCVVEDKDDSKDKVSLEELDFFESVQPPPTLSYIWNRQWALILS